MTSTDSSKWDIRPLNPQSDAAQIAEIYAWYVNNSTATFELIAPSPEAMESRLHAIASNYPAFVCEDADHILGYCYAHSWKSYSAYSLSLETTIYLRSGCDGQGIGKTLMKHLIEACRLHGFKTLIACITAENDTSCRFHEHLGFIPVSHFKEVGLKFNRFLSVVDYQLLLR